MTSPTAPEQQKFVGLPLMVVSPVDLGRLLRELETIDNGLLQQTLQKQDPKLPKTSKMMDELITLNHLNLLEKPQRERLKQFLLAVKEKAPLLHMSFSADPSEAFIEKLMSWIRENMHPLALLTVGLQPNIGAGAVVRTTNKYFDFSLAANFATQRELLMSKLQETTRPAAAQPVAAVPQEAAP